MNKYFIAISLISTWLIGFYFIFWGEGIELILKNWDKMKTVPPDKVVLKTLYFTLLGGAFIWFVIVSFHIDSMTIIGRLRLLGPFLMFILGNICIYQSGNISKKLSPQDPADDDYKSRPFVYIMVGIVCVIFSYLGLWQEVLEIKGYEALRLL